MCLIWITAHLLWLIVFFFSSPTTFISCHVFLFKIKALSHGAVVLSADSFSLLSFFDLVGLEMSSLTLWSSPQNQLRSLLRYTNFYEVQENENIILHNLQKSSIRKWAELLLCWMFDCLLLFSIRTCRRRWASSRWTSKEESLQTLRSWWCWERTVSCAEGFSLNLCGQGLKMVLNWTFQMFHSEAALEAVTHFIISKPILKNLI